MLFQKVQKRYTRLINIIYFLVLLLTNHETPYNLKISCRASTHLLSRSMPFLQLQVCDHKRQFATKHIYNSGESRNISAGSGVLGRQTLVVNNLIQTLLMQTRTVYKMKLFNKISMIFVGKTNQKTKWFASN